MRRFRLRHGWTTLISWFLHEPPPVIRERMSERTEPLESLICIFSLCGGFSVRWCWLVLFFTVLRSSSAACKVRVSPASWRKSFGADGVLQSSSSTWQKTELFGIIGKSSVASDPSPRRYVCQHISLIPSDHIAGVVSIMRLCFCSAITLPLSCGIQRGTVCARRLLARSFFSQRGKLAHLPWITGLFACDWAILGPWLAVNSTCSMAVGDVVSSSDRGLWVAMDVMCFECAG